MTHGQMKRENPRTGVSSGLWWPQCPCPHISAILSSLLSALPPSLVLTGLPILSVPSSLSLDYCCCIASCLCLSPSVMSPSISVTPQRRSPTLWHSGPELGVGSLRKLVPLHRWPLSLWLASSVCFYHPTPIFLTVPLPFSLWIPFVRLRMFLSSNLWVLSRGLCVDFTSLPPSSPYKPGTAAGPSLQPERECRLLSCWLPPKPPTMPSAPHHALLLGLGLAAPGFHSDGCLETEHHIPQSQYGSLCLSSDFGSIRKCGCFQPRKAREERIMVFAF